MAQEKSNNPETRQPEGHEAQLRSLISLFNWLVGEVVTARIMILRLAADLVRMGVLPIEEINGMPLTQEIIDSVMSNFPQDSVWQPLGQRLRNSLDALRRMDLQRSAVEDDDLDILDDDLDLTLAEQEDELNDLLEEDGALPLSAEPPAQVIYRHPDHERGVAEAGLFPRTSRFPGRRDN